MPDNIKLCNRIARFDFLKRIHTAIGLHLRRQLPQAVKRFQAALPSESNLKNIRRNGIRICIRFRFIIRPFLPNRNGNRQPESRFAAFRLPENLASSYQPNPATVMSKSLTRFYLPLLLAMPLLFAASLSVGVADFQWSRLFSLSDDMQLMMISRLPRTFAVVLTGASMAVAGMIMQILLKNRFVEPSMVGASQSAALGMLLMTLWFPAAPRLVGMSAAAVAALAGMLLFMALTRRLPPTAQLMVPLVGIIFGGVIDSVTTFIAYETDLVQLLAVWRQGEFSGVLQGRYELLWIGGLMAAAAYLIADQLTIAGLGDTVSVNLGLSRTTVLWAGLVIVAMITSLVMVTVGSIPFIGLVVPNIVSRMMGDKLRRSLPAVALLGASLVLACDIAGRLIRYPFEIPVSTIFGVVGTVLFLYLLLRKNTHAA